MAKPYTLARVLTMTAALSLKLMDQQNAEPAGLACFT